MEAVPRLPMICFDLKTSPEPAAYAPKLKQYIAEFYHEDPESYNNEFHALEGLRAAAVRPAKDVTGCSVLKRYYAQLHALQGRFPMEKGQPMAITFTWKDVYTSSSVSSNDIKFEMGAILYNIGALHTQLGAADSRNSADGMKLACTHFQCAAWAFQHLRNNYCQVVSEDLCSEIMVFMYSLSFAQAQECILEKSMADNRKATIVARIAVQVVDYYSTSLAILMTGGDDGPVADTVGSRVYKEWKKYIQFKIAFCGCVSLLYQGQQAEEQQKMGERVAFYQAAFNRLEEATKLAKGLPNATAIADALNFTNDVVEGKRKAAKNENEFIYHEEVPEMSALTQATGAPLVKGIPFSVTDKDVLGEDIFKRLVPLSAHEASSVYSEEKAQLLRDIGNRVETADMNLQTHLSALHLLGLQTMDENIPQALIDRCAALSAKPDTTEEITKAMDVLAETSNEVQTQLLEIQQILEKEDENEKVYIQAMGTRPVNSVIIELTREFNKYKEANAKAESSNDTLKRAMSMHVNNLQVLGRPLIELQAALPKLRDEDVLDENLKKRLQEILNKVDEMRTQRCSLYKKFREDTLADDITAKLVAWGDKPAEELFQKEIQKHKDSVALLDQNIAAQENILKALTEAYAECAPALKLQMEVMRKREHFCASLVASYDAYEDLLAKMTKGTDFYKKLHTNVSKLLARIKSVTNVQQEERIARLQTKNNPLKTESSITNIPSKNISTAPKLKDYLAAGYGTDSYRVPGVRPRPLGSEGTTESPVDNTNSSYTNSYYQSVNPGNLMPTSSQIYQTDSSYNAINYYTDYAKYGNQQVADKSLPTNLMPGYGYQYASNMQNILPHALPSSTANMGSVSNYSTNVSCGLANNSQANYPNSSMTNLQYSSISNNSVNNMQNYANSDVNLPNTSQSSSNNQSAILQGLKNMQDLNGQNNTMQNVIPAQNMPTQNYSLSNSSTDQNLAANQVAYSSIQNLQTNTNINSLHNQNYATNYQQLPQTFDTKQNYNPYLVSQQVSYNQNINTVDQQMSNLSLQVNPTANNCNLPVYQEKQSDLKTTLPNSGHLMYNQQMSYSGHPGYSLDPITGTYQYSSGYQDMQNYNNSSGNYAGQTHYTDQNSWQQSNYHYSNASNNLGTNNTLSSKSQGQNYSQQYPASTSQAMTDQYYMQMYGTTGSVDGSNIITPSIVYPLTPQSPMTYMNSGASMTNTTFSQDSSKQINSNINTKQTSGVQSNVDLLAGLDFSSSVPTLTPEQNSILNKKPDDSKNLHSADTVPQASVSTHKDVDEKSSVGQQDEKSVEAVKEEENIEVVRVGKQNILSELPQPPSKENLLRFLHEVERQEKYLDGITTKTLNGPTPLETKWKEMQDLLAPEIISKSISVARCYPAKNRCPDYLPYDQTRVVLKDIKNDYINASHVKDLSDLYPDFIITQAPMSNTIVDFWLVVWNENIETIVCLLTPKELDVSYFPTQKNSPLIFGDYKISLQSITENDFCIERVMSIKGNRDKPPKDFIHLQIKSTPKTSEIICGTLKEIVFCYQKQRSVYHPVLIHCQHGNGLSGVFVYAICAEFALRTSAPYLLDTLHICKQLCSQRKGLFKEGHDMLLAMEAEISNARSFLNSYNLMTAYQIQSKAKNNIPSTPQEPTAKDPFGDLDPLWQIRKKT